MCPRLCFYFVRRFILFIGFHILIQVRSYGICLSLTGLYLNYKNIHSPNSWVRGLPDSHIPSSHAVLFPRVLLGAAQALPAITHPLGNAENRSWDGFCHEKGHTLASSGDTAHSVRPPRVKWYPGFPSAHHPLESTVKHTRGVCVCVCVCACVTCPSHPLSYLSRPYQAVIGLSVWINTHMIMHERVTFIHHIRKPSDSWLHWLYPSSVHSSNE